MNTRIVCYVEGPDPKNCGVLAQDTAGPRDFYVWHNVPRNTLDRAWDSLGSQGPIFFDDTFGRSWLVGHFIEGDPHRFAGSAVALCPIPYEAAQGIKWSGQSMATGDGTLGRQLTALAATLESTTRWSFDSDYWQGRTLGDDGRFRMQRIKPSYVGLIEEPKNIFGSGD
jgi:hypothetical protein